MKFCSLLLIVVVLFALILAGCLMSENPANTSGPGRDEAASADATPRTPAQIRREGNHLMGESSLYLQQHAHNPLDWYPWGETALSLAKKQDKPIFLSIGYSSCHWCHVMEHEVFEDDETADFMNRHFVCIKVDREERPDLDSVYMSAVQTISGRGGWPLSVFLTPDLQPFFGGTYFPRDAFLDLVHKIREVYLESREDLVAQAAQIAKRALHVPGMSQEITADRRLSTELVENAAAQAPVNFDMRWGGFAGEQKFPTPARWQFLLHYYRRTGERQYLNLVRKTLEAMASGGIYDHVGGGFHRYTVEKTWLIPHFEKMLYDNAQLASLYLEAGVVMERSDFLYVGKDVLDFLLREMRESSGAFCASFDADSGGVEGSYYVWTPEDLSLATNAADGPVLADLLNVEGTGNFEGNKSVITRRTDLAQIAQLHERDPQEVTDLFQHHRAALRAYRAGRPAPDLDRKIVTAWNGLALSALAHGYAALGDVRYRDAAREAADFLWRVHHHGEGRLYRASNAGKAAHEAVLEDYAGLASGLLDLYQVTGDGEQLQRALLVLDHARAHFARPQGGWFLTSDEVEAPLGRRTELFDSVTPSGNGALLQALVRAAALTGREDYRQDVQKTLDTFVPLLERAGLEMACWIDAAALLLGPYYVVVIAGEPDGSAETPLSTAVLRRLPAGAVLARIPADGPGADLAAVLPQLAGKRAQADGRPVAYVCEYGSCHEPTSDPERLLEQVFKGWVR
jgi:uncharacterized protein YyaL (SSP411 family)